MQYKKLTSSTPGSYICNSTLVQYLNIFILIILAFTLLNVPCALFYTILHKQALQSIPGLFLTLSCTIQDILVSFENSSAIQDQTWRRAWILHSHNWIGCGVPVMALFYAYVYPSAIPQQISCYITSLEVIMLHRSSWQQGILWQCSTLHFMNWAYPLFPNISIVRPNLRPQARPSWAFLSWAKLDHMVELIMAFGPASTLSRPWARALVHSYCHSRQGQISVINLVDTNISTNSTLETLQVWNKYNVTF